MRWVSNIFGSVHNGACCGMCLYIWQHLYWNEYLQSIDSVVYVILILINYFVWCSRYWVYKNITASTTIGSTGTEIIFLSFLMVNE